MQQLTLPSKLTRTKVQLAGELETELVIVEPGHWNGVDILIGDEYYSLHEGDAIRLRNWLNEK